MLRVRVKDIPKQTTRLEFAFSNDVKVIGDFLIYNVTAGQSSLSSDEFQNTGFVSTNTINVTMPANNVWRDSVDINLPIPTVSALAPNEKGYKELTVTAYDSNYEVLLKVTCKIKSSEWKPERKAARRMTAPLPVFTAGSAKVIFAPGNLQWQYTKKLETGQNNQQNYIKFTHETRDANATSDVYEDKSFNGGMFFFAPYQWHICNTWNGPLKRTNKTSANLENNLAVNFRADANNNPMMNRLDLFVFASSGYRGTKQAGDLDHYVYKPFAVNDDRHGAGNGWYGVTENKDYEKTDYDWGWFNAIAKDQTGDATYAPGVWSLLSQYEWQYLLNTRNNAKAKRGFANIYGVNGLILLPDNWTWTPQYSQYEFVPFSHLISITDSDPGTITWTPYPNEVWAEMEAAGAVFLPAAGSISDEPLNTTDDSKNIKFANTAGYYWTGSTGTKEDDTHFIRTYCFNFGEETKTNNNQEVETVSHWRFDNSRRDWCRSVRLVRRFK